MKGKQKYFRRANRKRYSLPRYISVLPLHDPKSSQDIEGITTENEIPELGMDPIIATNYILSKTRKVDRVIREIKKIIKNNNSKESIDESFRKIKRNIDNFYFLTSNNDKFRTSAYSDSEMAIIRKETVVYRFVAKKSFNGPPPSELITSFGRINCKNQQVFYVALNWKTAFEEFHGDDQSENFYLKTYSIKKDIHCNIAYSNQFASPNYKRMLKRLGNLYECKNVDGEIYRYMNKLINTMFSIPSTNDGVRNELIYRISNYLVRNMFTGNKNCEGVLYTSTRMNQNIKNPYSFDPLNPKKDILNYSADIAIVRKLDEFDDFFELKTNIVFDPSKSKLINEILKRNVTLIKSFAPVKCFLKIV